MSMNEDDFQEYKERIFNTDLASLEKAIESSKSGGKKNKMETKYLQEIETNVDEMKKHFDQVVSKMK